MGLQKVKTQRAGLSARPDNQACYNSRIYALENPMAPRIAIYTGTGTSHSWLWFVDLFNSWGYYQLNFLDEADIQQGLLQTVDLLVISGGDTFAVAGALGSLGAARIKGFVQKGGVYIGSCAGAYLPMHSSKPLLNEFNFLKVKITNLSKQLPNTLRLHHKSYACYGCDFIFHPVRDEVLLDIDDPGQASGPHPQQLNAPLYGGPAMIAPDAAQVLARYSGFTPKTTFVVDQELAARTILGRDAVVKMDFGSGTFYLFGPHFEHPHYPQANNFMRACVDQQPRQDDALSSKRTPCWRQGPVQVVTGQEFYKTFLGLKREVSNSRIIASGLDQLSIYWRIGHKVYEPEKILVYLENIWSKLSYLEKCGTLVFQQIQASLLLRMANDLTLGLRKLKQAIDTGVETGTLFTDLFCILKNFARQILQIYFRTLYTLQESH